MAKLQLLNTFLTERLMAAVDEVMEMVGGTMLEYEEETARIRRENEFLKRRLREIGRESVTKLAREVPSDGQEEWSSSLEQEPESTAAQQNQNQGLTEQPTSIKSEGLCYPAGPISPESQNPTSAPTEAIFTSDCVEKNFNTYAESKVMVDCDLPQRIKTEPIETTDPQSVGTDTNYSTLPQTTDLDSASAATSYCKSHHGTDLQSVNTETSYGKSQFRTDLESVYSDNSHSKSLPRTFLESVNTDINYSMFQPAVLESARADTTYSSSQHAADPESVGAVIPDGITGQIGSDGLLRALRSDPSTAGPDLSQSASSVAAARRRRAGVKGQGSYMCPQCGKLFLHRSRLKVHTRIHTGEKPYACGQCGKRFNNDGTLRNHQRVHLQVRLYGCPVCSMSFKDAYTCRKHLRVHAKAGPNPNANPAALAKHANPNHVPLAKHIRTYGQDMG